jgi:hypothetical protein
MSQGLHKVPSSDPKYVQEICEQARISLGELGPKKVSLGVILAILAPLLQGEQVPLDNTGAVLAALILSLDDDQKASFRESLGSALELAKPLQKKKWLPSGFSLWKVFSQCFSKRSENILSSVEIVPRSGSRKRHSPQHDIVTRPPRKEPKTTAREVQTEDMTAVLPGTPQVEEPQIVHRSQVAQF